MGVTRAGEKRHVAEEARCASPTGARVRAVAACPGAGAKRHLVEEARWAVAGAREQYDQA